MTPDGLVCSRMGVRGTPVTVRHPLSLPEINALNPDQFQAHFAAVLEHSPQYAAQVARGQPYANVEALAAAFPDAFSSDTEVAQLALIRAHPDLAGKAALAGELTSESAQEQASAGDRKSVV